MKKIIEVVNQRGTQLKEMLVESGLTTNGFTLEQYKRYLQMQYHLTNGVQKHFFRMASNHKFCNKKQFREFLIRFALEEESHFLLAKKDLKNLDLEVGEEPLDVKLWWSYFNSIIDEKPFVRLGATCVLENMGCLASNEIKMSLQKTPFLNQKNTSFIVIHQHEELPHGDEIYGALDQYGPNEEELADLYQGAMEGGEIFFRLLYWIVDNNSSELGFKISA